MSERAERPGDGWGRGPTVFALTPDLHPDWTADTSPESYDDGERSTPRRGGRSDHLVDGGRVRPAGDSRERDDPAR